MPRQKDIDWIFFDIGGVLADDTALEDARDGIITSTVEKVWRKPTAEEMRAARLAASAQIGDMTANTIDALLPDHVLAATAKVEAELIKQSFPSFSSLSSIRPEAKAILERLSSVYRLGIMANQPTRTRDKLKSAGILGLFSQTGMSADYNYHKPDVRLYEEILRETGASPERSVMVDDNYERGLHVAKRLGFRVVWFEEPNSRFRSPDMSPDWVIHNLNDLLDIFCD